MKILICIFFLFVSFKVFNQSVALNKFSADNEAFKGTNLEQASYLLREIKAMGIVRPETTILPAFLKAMIVDSIPIVKWSKIDKYLKSKKIDLVQIGGDTALLMCCNKNGTKAKYFVIHDTSHPNFFEKDFPSNINHFSWEQNDVKKIWEGKKLAHAFVGRTGESYCPDEFSNSLIATKFEKEHSIKKISKGLFLHIELVQPRKSDPQKWVNNDVIAPVPGFTELQYQRLALLYLCTSTRTGSWLIPVFHAVLDEGKTNAHDDPQNFDLSAFSNSLEILYKQISQL